MKKQVYTDMPLNKLNDLLVLKDKASKNENSHSVSPMENPMQIKYSEERWQE